MRLPSFKSVLFFALAAIVFIVFSTTDRVSAYKQLVDRHSMTMATASSTECSNHGKINYVFEVQDKNYAGHTYGSGIKMPCRNVNLDYAFPVYYDPLDPRINSPMTPKDAYHYYWLQFFWHVSMGLYVVWMLLYRK